MEFQARGIPITDPRAQQSVYVRFTLMSVPIMPLADTRRVFRTIWDGWQL